MHLFVNIKSKKNNLVLRQTWFSILIRDGATNIIQFIQLPHLNLLLKLMAFTKKRHIIQKIIVCDNLIHMLFTNRL